MTRRFLTPFITALFSSLLAIAMPVATATASDVKEAPELGKRFEEAGVKGTFVLYRVGEDSFQIYNPERAKTRFIPASTFKIANSIIGLQVGAVKNVDTILPYGGKKQARPEWEQDMSLREAIKVSNVPVYQGVARKIGMSQMNSWLEILDYGNRQTGPVIDQFWLKGPLKISAIEQTQFLAKVAEGNFPVKPEVIKQVKEITLDEKTETYEIHGKTGWATEGDPDLGWWVGWVEKDGKLFTFALNMDMPAEADAPKRKEIATACLKDLGVL